MSTIASPNGATDVSEPSSALGARRLLIVALPALNEEATVADVVARVPRDFAPDLEVVVLVIDDGSTDATVTKATEAGAEVISHANRRGVGAAFHTTLRTAIARGADLIATIDADGQFNPADIPALVAPVLSGEADFSTASRFKDAKLVPKMPAIKKWGNRMMSRLISRLAGQTFYDVSCGMRCYGRRAMLSLNLMGEFTYTQEVFLNLAFKGLDIVEVPIVVQGERAHGKSRVASNLFRYAMRASMIIFRCFRDYQPMRFFGGIAQALLAPALVLFVFLMTHYVTTGSFSPHKWAGFTSAILVVLAVISLHLGLVGDMLARHRMYLEELLFNQRMTNAWQRMTADQAHRGNEQPPHDGPTHSG